MYTVIINEGQGFTETKKEFTHIKDVWPFALQYDNAHIYRGKKRIK